MQGRTLVTAESCTGGGIGSALTTIPGSSSVYKGGIICYTNWVKEQMLDVDKCVLENYGAVSNPVAAQMASGVRNKLKADVAVSVTGLAGPGGDAHGHVVGTVYIGYEDQNVSIVKHMHFTGSRDEIRRSTIIAALQMILENN